MKYPQWMQNRKALTVAELIERLQGEMIPKDAIVLCGPDPRYIPGNCMPCIEVGTDGERYVLLIEMEGERGNE